MRRCRWCGRFVKATAEPITGVNWHGTEVTQLLCPEDRPHWLMLIERNRNHAAGLGWVADRRVSA